MFLTCVIDIPNYLSLNVKLHHYKKFGLSTIVIRVYIDGEHKAYVMQVNSKIQNFKILNF